MSTRTWQKARDAFYEKLVELWQDEDFPPQFARLPYEENENEDEGLTAAALRNLTPKLSAFHAIWEDLAPLWPNAPENWPEAFKALTDMENAGLLTRTQAELQELQALARRLRDAKSAQDTFVARLADTDSDFEPVDVRTLKTTAELDAFTEWLKAFEKTRGMLKKLGDSRKDSELQALGRTKDDFDRIYQRRLRDRIGELRKEFPGSLPDAPPTLETLELLETFGRAARAGRALGNNLRPLQAPANLAELKKLAERYEWARDLQNGLDELNARGFLLSPKLQALAEGDEDVRRLDRQELKDTLDHVLRIRSVENQLNWFFPDGWPKGLLPIGDPRQLGSVSRATLLALEQKINKASLAAVDEDQEGKNKDKLLKIRDMVRFGRTPSKYKDTPTLGEWLREKARPHERSDLHTAWQGLSALYGGQLPPSAKRKARRAWLDAMRLRGFSVGSSSSSSSSSSSARRQARDLEGFAPSPLPFVPLAPKKPPSKPLKPPGGPAAGMEFSKAQLERSKGKVPRFYPLHDVFLTNETIPSPYVRRPLLPGECDNIDVQDAKEKKQVRESFQSARDVDYGPLNDTLVAEIQEDEVHPVDLTWIPELAPGEAEPKGEKLNRYVDEYHLEEKRELTCDRELGLVKFEQNSCFADVSVLPILYYRLPFLRQVIEEDWRNSGLGEERKGEEWVKIRRNGASKDDVANLTGVRVAIQRILRDAMLVVLRGETVSFSELREQLVLWGNTVELIDQKRANPVNLGLRDRQWLGQSDTSDLYESLRIIFYKARDDAFYSERKWIAPPGQPCFADVESFIAADKEDWKLLTQHGPANFITRDSPIATLKFDRGPDDDPEHVDITIENWDSIFLNSNDTTVDPTGRQIVRERQLLDNSYLGIKIDRLYPYKTPAPENATRYRSRFVRVLAPETLVTRSRRVLDLVAVQVHAGAHVGGHYWQYIKCQSTGDWLYIDSQSPNRDYINRRVVPANTIRDDIVSRRAVFFLYVDTSSLKDRPRPRERRRRAPEKEEEEEEEEVQEVEGKQVPSKGRAPRVGAILLKPSETQQLVKQIEEDKEIDKGQLPPRASPVVVTEPDEPEEAEFVLRDEYRQDIERGRAAHPELEIPLENLQKTRTRLKQQDAEGGPVGCERLGFIRWRKDSCWLDSALLPMLVYRIPEMEAILAWDAPYPRLGGASTQEEKLLWWLRAKTVRMLKNAVFLLEHGQTFLFPLAKLFDIFRDIKEPRTREKALEEDLEEEAKNAELKAKGRGGECFWRKWYGQPKNISGALDQLVQMFRPDLEFPVIQKVWDATWKEEHVPRDVGTVDWHAQRQDWFSHMGSEIERTSGFDLLEPIDASQEILAANLPSWTGKTARKLYVDLMVDADALAVTRFRQYGQAEARAPIDPSKHLEIETTSGSILELVAVVVHHGNHFMTYMRCPYGANRESQWYKYDGTHPPWSLVRRDASMYADWASAAEFLIYVKKDFIPLLAPLYS